MSLMTVYKVRYMTVKLDVLVNETTSFQPRENNVRVTKYKVAMLSRESPYLTPLRRRCRVKRDPGRPTTSLRRIP